MQLEPPQSELLPAPNASSLGENIWAGGKFGKEANLLQLLTNIQ